MRYPVNTPRFLIFGPYLNEQKKFTATGLCFKRYGIHLQFVQKAAANQRVATVNLGQMATGFGYGNPYQQTRHHYGHAEYHLRFDTGFGV